MTAHEDLVSQTARTLLRRYGDRLTLPQLAEFMGRPPEHFDAVPVTQLPRMRLRKIGTVVYCLDAARYICSLYSHP